MKTQSGAILIYVVYVRCMRVLYMCDVCMCIRVRLSYEARAQMHTASTPCTLGARGFKRQG